MADRLDTLRLDIDLLISALTIGYTPHGHIGTKVLPYYIVSADNIEAPIFGKESFRLVDSRRGLRTKPKEVEFSVDSQTASLVEHALQSKVDYLEEEAGNVAGWSPRQKAANTVKATIAVNREYEIGTLMTATTTFATNHSTTLTNKWDVKSSNVSTYNPFDDIETGIQKVRSVIGMKPNLAYCGETAWSTIRNNTLVQAAMPGGTGAENTVKNVTKEAFADLIGVAEFHVGESVYSADGSAMTDIWGDDFGLLYVDKTPNASETPAFGWTLTRQYGEVDGMAMLGVAGIDETEGGRWWNGYWYVERYLPWVALDTAGYLIKTVNT